MSLAEVLPGARLLSRAEKLQLIQYLAEDLGREEIAALIPPGQSYPVWSPLEAYDAAAILLKVLEVEPAKP